MYIPEDDDVKLDDVNLEETEENEEEAEVEDDMGSDEEASEDEADDEADPSDLAEAYNRVRQMDAGSPEGDVDGGDGAGDDGDAEADDADAEGDLASDTEGDDADGGFTELPDAAAYQSYEQELMQELTNYSISSAIKRFTDKGIKPITINDLYTRTDDGRAVYRNPDDSSRPFNNRMEAQQWIDSFNNQLRDDVRREANRIKIQTAKQMKPSIELMRFAPRFDSMSKSEQSILDDLIEDYEVRNANGEIIGYNCDLNRMADKAVRLAAKYNPSSKKVGGNGKIRKSGPQKSPALDAKTHGTASGSKGDREPQTMEEAMKRLREMNRSKR